MSSKKTFKDDHLPPHLRAYLKEPEVMASDTVPQFFRCPYKHCFAAFESEALLRKHKITNPEHDFCALCNMDFEDDGALLVHKIESKRHITCPVCGTDFKSLGGQALHIEQMHAAKQDLTCVGCGMNFQRCGPLIAHIEHNICPKISMEQVELSRQQKSMMRLYLADPERFVFPPNFDKEALMAKYGGGKMATLEDLSLVEEEDYFFGVGSTVIYPTEQSSANADLLSDRLMPDDGGPIMGFTNMHLDSGKGNDDREEGNKAELLTIRDEPVSAPGSPKAPSTVAPPRTLGPAITFTAKKDKPKTEEGGQEYIDNLNPWDPRSQEFIAAKHLHPITRKYMCPHPGCSSQIKTLHGFKQHLMSESASHLNQRIICPLCLKTFKSHTALIQHCESASSRCQIRRAMDYNQHLDVLTGGLLEVKGYHPDGTLEYATSKVKW